MGTSSPWTAAGRPGIHAISNMVSSKDVLLRFADASTDIGVFTDSAPRCAGAWLRAGCAFRCDRRAAVDRALHRLPQRLEAQRQARSDAQGNDAQGCDREEAQRKRALAARRSRRDAAQETAQR